MCRKQDEGLFHIPPLFFHLSKTVPSYGSSINSFRGSTVQCWATLQGVLCVCYAKAGGDTLVSPLRKKKMLPAESTMWLTVRLM